VSRSLLFIIVVIMGTVLLPSFAFVEDLVGPVSRELILKHSPAWEGVAAAYQPDPAVLDRLRGLGREARIEVYFGIWCSDSAALVPAFFKLIDTADTPLLQAVYTAVPEAKEKRAPYCRDREVIKLPTFVILLDGREAGRIVETPEKSLEADLARILGL
jgi:hypothetical protein